MTPIQPSNLFLNCYNPFLSYECKSFAQQYAFQFKTCSPYYHQSNGLAERACGIARQMLNKCIDDPSTNLQQCLLQYRATVISDLGASPAQLLMSRQLRTKLPTIRSCLLKPCIVSDAVEKLCDKQKKMSQDYDRSAFGTEVKYCKGDYVYVQNALPKLWEPGVICDVCDEPRSYMIQTSGRPLRRNACMIMPRTNNDPIVDNDVIDNFLYQQVFKKPVPVINNEIPIVEEIPVVRRTSTRTKKKPVRLDL